LEDRIYGVDPEEWGYNKIESIAFSEKFFAFIYTMRTGSRGVKQKSPPEGVAQLFCREDRINIVDPKVGGYKTIEPIASAIRLFVFIPMRTSSRGIKTKKPAQRRGSIVLSGRQDSNLRPPGPKPGALPACATSRISFTGLSFNQYFQIPKNLRPFCHEAACATHRLFY
jgi:hypothetical protein